MDINLLTQDAITLLAERRPIAISGPSGVGKGTLCQRLLDEYSEAFATGIPHKSQALTGEFEGSSYYYVSQDKFGSLIAEKGRSLHAIMCF
jgi:guanylate kinase